MLANLVGARMPRMKPHTAPGSQSPAPEAWFGPRPDPRSTALLRSFPKNKKVNRLS
jgi:hypothetical protein